MSEVVHNIRIRFSKQGDVRFTSHHDTMRLFERALKRAALPVAMSEGFNPRPRLSLPMPLSVGMAGLNEVADVRLEGWIRPEEVRSRLQAELPEGIGINFVETIPSNANRQPREIAYRIPLLPGHGLTGAKIDELLQREEYVVQRRGKERSKKVEIRRFIKAVRLSEDAVLLLLAYGAEGTARPDEVMEALGCREGADFLKGETIRTNVNLSP